MNRPASSVFTAPLVPLTAPMQKVILRLQVFEVLETVARLEHALDLALQQELVAGALMLQQTEALIKRLKARLGSRSRQLKACLQDVPDLELTRPGLNAMHEVLEQCRTEAERVADALWALNPKPSDAALYRTLEELAPLSLLTNPTERMVMTQCAGQTTAPWPLAGSLVERLPVLATHDPLKWVGLVRQVCMQLYLEHPDRWVLAPINQTTSSNGTPGRHHALEERAKDTAEPLLRRLVPHLLGLRLLGPAYYAFLVTEALCQRQVKFLTQVEPVLFFGLNFFNCTHNSIVILHEAIERASNWLTPVTRPLAESPNSPPAAYRKPELYTNATNALLPETTAAMGSSASGFNGNVPYAQQEELSLEALEGWDEVAFKASEPMASWIPSLLKVVEDVIPDRLAFGSKRYKQSLALVARLRAGLPISASSPFSLEAQREGFKPLSEFAGLSNTEASNASLTPELFYQAMQRSVELPHTASEILNAGWLFKLEQLPHWLNEALEEGATVREPLSKHNGIHEEMAVTTASNGAPTASNTLTLERLKHRLTHLDSLLAKSIETSQVHRFLMQQEPVSPNSLNT